MNTDINIIIELRLLITYVHTTYYICVSTWNKINLNKQLYALYDFVYSNEYFIQPKDLAKIS